jgi:hypothetical protein
MEEKQIEQSSKYERNLAKREQKLDEQKHAKQKRMIKRVILWSVAVLAVGGGIGALVWNVATRPALPDEEIISRNGLHWHPQIAIFINGERQEISPTIGLGVVHGSIHTHDSNGEIHLEFPSVVRKNDLRLGRFFEAWGKKFTSECIFDFCNGSEGTLKMLVNGEENHEFADYLMKDGDKIEIRYE